MTLTPTLRLDGDYKVTVRVTHHLQAEQMIGAMVAGFWNEFGDSPARVSKSVFERELRDLLGRKGAEALTYWSDDIEDDDEARTWATDRIHELYPEFKLHPEPN